MYTRRTNIPVRLVHTKYQQDEKRKQFYGSMRFTLIVCRCMGLLPIDGLRKKDGGATRFTLKSLYSIVFIPSIVMQTVITVLMMCHLISEHLNRQAFMDFAGCIFTYIMFLILSRFAMTWHKTLHDIEDMELLLPPIEDYKKMAIFIKSLTILVLIMGLVERVVFTMSTWVGLSGCQVGSNDGLKTYYLLMFDWFYQFVPFSYSSGIVVQVLMFQGAFVWNYNDVLVIFLSVYLTSRFKNFNRILKEKQQNMISKPYSPSWSTLQVHYTRISRLVAIVDDNISSMVFVSYAWNLMYIFKLIFIIINNLKDSAFIDYTTCGNLKSHNTATTAGLVFSTVHVITRTALVSFLSAKLHTTSREPLDALHTAPASAYDTDMQRLMNQVYYSKVCLTGCNFFSVTRNMILAMVATLITYEVVMFQF